MNKTCLTLILFLFVNYVKAQNFVRIKGPVPITGVNFKEGDSILIGKPVGEKGNFKYIHKPFDDIYSEKELDLSGSYSGSKFPIAKFKQGTWRGRGYRTFIIIVVKNREYIVDAEIAFNSGELVFNKEKLSLSSQLEELSKLHQKGILTDEEFKAAKAKLLN